MCAQDYAVRGKPDALNDNAPYKTDIAHYCQRVVAAIQPICVILRGSVAKGTYRATSDVDIVVIGGQLPDNFIRRLGLLLELNDTSASIEPLVYTGQEFEQMLEERHVTALDALHYGLPLHGEEYFHKLRGRFEALVARGLHRTNCTWTMTQGV